MSVAVAGVIAVVFALAATVVAFVLVVPDSRRATLGKFGKFLHDTVNFKYLIVEKILQALYIFATAYVLLQGFFLLFSVQESFWGDTKWLGGYGFLLMIFGPIAVRLVYELLMMAVLLVKNVIQINNKLKGDDAGAEVDLFRAPAVPVMPKPPAYAAPAPVADGKPLFCPQCGARLADDGTCPAGHR